MSATHALLLGAHCNRADLGPADLRVGLEQDAAHGGSITSLAPRTRCALRSTVDRERRVDFTDPQLLLMLASGTLLLVGGILDRLWRVRTGADERL